MNGPRARHCEATNVSSSSTIGASGSEPSDAGARRTSPDFLALRRSRSSLRAGTSGAYDTHRRASRGGRRGTPHSGHTRSCSAQAWPHAMQRDGRPQARQNSSCQFVAARQSGQRLSLRAHHRRLLQGTTNAAENANAAPTKTASHPPARSAWYVGRHEPPGANASTTRMSMSDPVRSRACMMSRCQASANHVAESASSPRLQ